MTVKSIPQLKQAINLLKRHKVKLWKYPLKKHIMEDTVLLNDVLEKITELEKSCLETTSELSIVGKKTRDSLSDFYKRLPDIKDAKIAMVEFQEHTSDLIDFILKLEEAFNRLLEATT